MKLFSHRKRPVHLGPYPLERLPRLADPQADPAGSAAGAARPGEKNAPGEINAGHAFAQYTELFDAQLSGQVAPPAPIPSDPVERTNNLKAGAYFLDADMVGTCLVPAQAWDGTALPHTYAVGVRGGSGGAG